MAPSRSPDSAASPAAWPAPGDSSLPALIAPHGWRATTIIRPGHRGEGGGARAIAGRSSPGRWSASETNAPSPPRERRSFRNETGGPTSCCCDGPNVHLPHHASRRPRRASFLLPADGESSIGRDPGAIWRRPIRSVPGFMPSCGSIPTAGCFAIKPQRHVRRRSANRAAAARVARFGSGPRNFRSIKARSRRPSPTCWGLGHRRYLMSAACSRDSSGKSRCSATRSGPGSVRLSMPAAVGATFVSP